MTELEASEWLYHLRWPEVWVCPCGSASRSTRPGRLTVCTAGHQISTTSGSGMHKTQIPLATWIEGARLVADGTPPRISGPGLGRALSLHAEPAWKLHRYLQLAREAAGPDADRMLAWILAHSPTWPPAPERTPRRRSEIGRMGAQARFDPEWMRNP